MKQKLLPWTLLALLALPAGAATVSVDRTVSASADADVSVELIAGKVRVVAWSRNEVRVHGTLNDEYETLEVRGDGDDISIEVEIPEGRSNRRMNLEADLEINVPESVELTVETISAPVTVEGLRNALSIESISGSVTVGAGLRELEIESISGRVEIDGGRDLDSVDVEAVSGSIEYRGDLLPDGDYSFSVVSGEITLHVPEGASAEYEIETFSGRIDNDFGPDPRRGELLPTESLNFSVGSGSADVSIEAVSGSIRLRAD